MKPLLIASLLALAAPQASARDWNFSFRFGHRGNSIRIGTGHSYRHHRRHYCQRHWVPVTYGTVRYREWVPAHTERHWVPAVYRTRHDRFGNVYRVVIRRGYWHTRHVRAHYEWCTRQVRRGGYWEYTCNTPHHSHAHHRR